MDDQHVRLMGYQHDRRKVPLRIVGKLAEVAGCRRNLPRSTGQQRVPVRRRGRDRLRRDGAARSRTILDQDWLSGHLAEFARHHSTYEVNTAAGWVADDHPYGLGRVGLLRDRSHRACNPEGQRWQDS